MTDGKRMTAHRAGCNLLAAILERDDLDDELHDSVANALILLDDDHPYPADLIDAALAYTRARIGGKA